MWAVTPSLHSMAFGIEEDIGVELLEVAEHTWVQLGALEVADGMHRTVAEAEQETGEDGSKVHWYGTQLKYHRRARWMYVGSRLAAVYWELWRQPGLSCSATHSAFSP